MLVTEATEMTETIEVIVIVIAVVIVVIAIVVTTATVITIEIEAEDMITITMVVTDATTVVNSVSCHLCSSLLFMWLIQYQTFRSHVSSQIIKGKAQSNTCTNLNAVSFLPYSANEW